MCQNIVNVEREIFLKSDNKMKNKMKKKTSTFLNRHKISHTKKIPRKKGFPIVNKHVDTNSCRIIG